MWGTGAPRILPVVNRFEAEEHRDRMSVEHPDRETHSFILSERDGVWTVAKVALPPVPATGRRPAAPRAATPVQHRNGPRLPGGLQNWSAGP